MQANRTPTIPSGNSLQARFGRAMVRRGWTVAVAESCTGGGLGALITSVPGSSEWFAGGVIAYANEVKVRLLGVSARVLEKHGAVSAVTAKQMALGVKKRFGTNVGIGITGIAGPGGGSAGKPTGLVFIGLAEPRWCRVCRVRFVGGRSEVRRKAVATSLRLLLESLA